MKNKKSFLKNILPLLLIASLFYISATTFLMWKTSAGEDTTPPVLKSFSINPKVINTEAGEDQITITAVITDDSGERIEHPYLVMAPESGAEHMYLIQGEFQHTTGDTYVGIYTFPQYVAKGKWHVETFAFADSTYNETILSKSDIEAIAGVGSATINNVATIEDITPPKLESFEIMKKEMNTENSEDTVRFKARITDDRTGVDSTELTVMFADNPDSSHRFNCNMEAVEEEENIYDCEITFPWGVAKGWWKVELRLQDTFGNYIYHYTPDIAKQFGVNESRFFNAASIDDLIPPELVSFTVTPSTFDSSKGEIELVAEARITDNMTGVVTESIHIAFSSVVAQGGVGFYDFERISGNQLDGIYRSTIIVPEETPTGILWADGVAAHDGTGVNFGCTIGKTVDTNSFLLINSANANEITIENTDWILGNDRVTIVFPEGTVIKKFDNGPFAFHRMLNMFYDVKELGGFSQVAQAINTAQSETEVTPSDIFNTILACNKEENCVETRISETGLKGDPIGLVRAGIPGISMTFSKPVEIEIKKLFDYEGQELVIQTFHEGGDEWIDETTCLVKEVEYFRVGEKGGGWLSDGTFLDPENPPKAVSCIFTVDHASFFGLNTPGTTTVLPETGQAIIAIVLLSIGCVLAYILSRKYTLNKNKDVQNQHKENADKREQEEQKEEK